MQEKISERDLDAAAARLPVTSAYCDFMRGLYGRPYPVLAAAFFAIEYVYNQVMTWCLHQQCCRHLQAHNGSHPDGLRMRRSIHGMHHAPVRQAWAGVMGGDSRYQEFAERWGSADFSTYVEQLRSHADKALQTASVVRT